MQSKIDQNKRAALVAYWMCRTDEAGKPLRNKDIPDRVGPLPAKNGGRKKLSPTEVSRLAEKARALGWLQTVNTLNLDPELLDWVQSQMTSYSHLYPLVRSHFPEVKQVYVVQAAVKDPLADDPAWDTSADIFSQNLAPILANLLRRQGRLVGIAWGRTLARASAAMVDSQSHDNMSTDRDIRFFPMWGSLYRPSVSEAAGLDRFAGTSSSALAQELQRTFRFGQEPTPSLHGLPAILPEAWGDVGVASFKRRRGDFLRDMSFFTSYDAIYGTGVESSETPRKAAGGRKPLVERMDAALVTVGAQAHESRFYQGDSFTHYFGKHSEADVNFKKYCIGDIGGVLLPNTSISERTGKSEEFIDSIAARFTCTQKYHLRHLAVRAISRDDDLGVTAIVHGSLRIGALMQALREGLINTLIVCNHLAKKLTDCLSRS